MSRLDSFIRRLEAQRACLNSAAELSPRRIRVNVVIPGATETPIWGRSMNEQQISALRDGGVVASDPPVDCPELEALPLPDGIAAGRYHLYRRVSRQARS